MNTTSPPLLDAAGLKQLATTRDEASAATPCPCRLQAATAWESITEERWPEALMQRVGTLRDPELHEPTFEEWHPAGTRYDSPDAPISVAHFPYNRCDVYRCASCTRLVLRYTEFGGYYVDHRVRVVDPALITG
ncbi:hypothetical protein QTI51_11620 [Variovorax sp. J22G73]|uniref:hypothetical protein n=1 Tax=unclassified Variovorax TaxID=663243 RepID=UPI000D5FB19B|nr:MULTISPECIES: hypothetical protein [unclassified Variovorax]MDM0006050.1 hypothetical protein [Variovorax sp. J22R203]MDM0097926.1 hypothetical protein [Variovorax sp. J22G73]